MKRLTLVFLFLLVIFSTIACDAANPYPETMWTRDINACNIYPVRNFQYDLGSATANWHQLHVENANIIILNDTVRFVNLPVFANNAAALGGGLMQGQLYRTGGDPDLLCIVH